MSRPRNKLIEIDQLVWPRGTLACEINSLFQSVLYFILSRLKRVAWLSYTAVLSAYISTCSYVNIQTHAHLFSPITFIIKITQSFWHRNLSFTSLEMCSEIDMPDYFLSRREASDLRCLLAWHMKYIVIVCCVSPGILFFFLWRILQS